MADIRINWEAPLDKMVVDSISIYRYAGITLDCDIIRNDGALVVENLPADSNTYDDLNTPDSSHFTYGVYSKNVTGFSPCARANISLVPTAEGSPTGLTAVYVAAKPVNGPTNITPTVELAPKYGVDTSIFVYPLFLTETESDFYDSQFGGSGTSHTMTYNSVTYYMPDNGGTHAGTQAPIGVTINGNEFTYSQIVTGFENGHKPTNNQGPTSLTLKVDMDEDGFYADVDFDDNDPSVNIAPDASGAPTNLTSTEEALAPTNRPTTLEAIASPINGPTDLGTIASPNEAPSDLSTTASLSAAPSDLSTIASPSETPSDLSTIANPSHSPTNLTSVEEILAPTFGPTDLITTTSPGSQSSANSFSDLLYPIPGGIINGFYEMYTGQGVLEITATTATWDDGLGTNVVIWSQSGGDSLATTTNFLAGWNITASNYLNGAYQDVTISYTATNPEAPSGLSTLLDADEDGHYADVDVDDNDSSTGLYPDNVELTYNGAFTSTTPELRYIQGYGRIKKNGDTPMNGGTYIYIIQGQTVTFTNDTTSMFYLRKQNDSENLLSIMGRLAPSNTGSYTFNELGDHGFSTSDVGSITPRFRVVPENALLDTFDVLDQGAAAGQNFAGNYNWDNYENNPSSIGWLQGIVDHGDTGGLTIVGTVPSGYSTTHGAIIYRKSGTDTSPNDADAGLFRFETISNGQDTKKYLYASFGSGSYNNQKFFIYEITDQRPYTYGEALPSWFISELAAEGYHISYT